MTAEGSSLLLTVPEGNERPAVCFCLMNDCSSTEIRCLIKLGQSAGNQYVVCRVDTISLLINEVREDVA